MMKTSTVKTILILAVFAITIIFSIGSVQTLKITLLTGVVGFIFGLLLAQLSKYNSLYNKPAIEKPKWNDSINIRNPLTYIQIIAFLLLTAGAGSIIGGLILEQIINHVGIVILATGFGTFIGIKLTFVFSLKT